MSYKCNIYLNRNIDYIFLQLEIKLIKVALKGNDQGPRRKTSRETLKFESKEFEFEYLVKTSMHVLACIFTHR